MRIRIVDRWPNDWWWDDRDRTVKWFTLIEPCRQLAQFKWKHWHFFIKNTVQNVSFVYGMKRVIKSQTDIFVIYLSEICNGFHFSSILLFVNGKGGNEPSTSSLGKNGWRSKGRLWCQTGWSACIMQSN